MSPGQKERFLAVATITAQLKMHFPKDAAAALDVLKGGIIGFYVRPDGEIVVRKMP